MTNEYFYFIDAALLEHCVRDELNKTAPRRLAVIDPLEINIVNFKNLTIVAWLFRQISSYPRENLSTLKIMRSEPKLQKALNLYPIQSNTSDFYQY